MPGPSSSQLGIAIGSLRAGRTGGIAAWLGFTLPSAIAMTVIGLGFTRTDVAGAGWVHGLELVSVAVVLTAVVSMQRSLAPDPQRLVLAGAAMVVALAVTGVAGQSLSILAGALVGLLLFRHEVDSLDLRLPATVGRRFAIGCLTMLGALLVALPVLREWTGSQAVALTAAMVRAGSLVFGGGHVVLPLLDQSVVDPGWVSEPTFLAGYGAVQAMPGPLFTFSAYLGAVSGPEPNGITGAAIALLAIFLPSFLLVWGVLPLWAAVRRHELVQAAIRGIGAVVVGLLAAALVDPVIRTAIDSGWDIVLAAALVLALRVAPVWAVVIVAALVGELVL